MSDIRFGSSVPPVEAEGPRHVEIPPARYTSASFMELERAHLWPDVWLVAGVARDVTRPGDYFVFELGDESVLVVRDLAGNVNAFHNVCLHRGHLLRDPGRGSCSAFVCPYHAWEWNLDGTLDKVPNRAKFPQGFPEDRRSLARLACRVWAGLVWVSLAEPRQSLEQYLGPIHEHVGRYRLEELHVNADWSAEWPCNWKTAIDGFNETYHGPVTHPQFSELLDTLSARFQFGERHSLFVIEHGVLPPSQSGEVVQGPIADALRRAGGDPVALAGRPDEARAIVQRWVREQGARDGHDLGALSDPQLTDTHHFYVFPNVHIDFHGANDVTIQRFRPHPRDPERCYVEAIDMKRVAGDHAVARPAHIDVPLGGEQIGIVYTQDIERVSRVQRGMRSRGFQGAQLSQMERRIHHMHLVIDEHLGEHLEDSLRTRVREPTLA